MFGLVGPDGAGKTTTIRILCGLLKPDSGYVELLGSEFKKSKKEIQNQIGYLSQKFSLYGDLSVDENIEFFAEIHNVIDFKVRRDELLAFTRLTPFRDRLAEKLSGGMKQKLALACSLIHKPKIIFLDEPTTGVDPVSRRDFWKILSDLQKEGIQF
jgi:ABC-2 type transport system ATP-binding protein